MSNAIEKLWPLHESLLDFVLRVVGCLPSWCSASYNQPFWHASCSSRLWKLPALALHIDQSQLRHDLEARLACAVEAPLLKGKRASVAGYSDWHFRLFRSASVYLHRARPDPFEIAGASQEAASTRGCL